MNEHQTVPVPPTAEMIKAGRGWREWDRNDDAFSRAFQAACAAAPPNDELARLLDRFVARGENAYSQMISQARQDECLGWEIKVENNKFGRAELDAHNKAAELLGRHRAMMEAAKELRGLLERHETEPGLVRVKNEPTN